MTSTFDDGASDWALEYDTTTALDDDSAMEQDDIQSDGSLASADEQAEDDATDGLRFGGTITHEELTNPDTGNNLEWEVSEGWTDAGTGDPVDYWDSEQTVGDAAAQPHFGESVTARDDSLGHDVDVDFSSGGSSWGKDSEGRDVWRNASGTLHVYE